MDFKRNVSGPHNLPRPRGSGPVPACDVCCQLIISSITGQKTSHHLQTVLSVRVRNLSYLVIIYCLRKTNCGCCTTDIDFVSLALSLHVFGSNVGPATLRLTKKPLESAKVHSYCWLVLKSFWSRRAFAQLQSDQIKFSLRTFWWARVNLNNGFPVILKWTATIR